jgi:hypothetical protein
MWAALLLFGTSLVVPAFGENDKSVAEAYPLVVVVFVIASVVGVLISMLALKALWKARANED